MLKRRVAEVVFDFRSVGKDAVYTYEDRVNAEIGEAYLAPLGPRMLLGYVISIKEIFDDELGFEPKKLKPLGPCVVGLGLSKQALSLIEYISKEYLTTLSSALSLAIPPKTLYSLQTKWMLQKDFHSKNFLLSARVSETVQVIQKLGGEILESKEKPLDSKLKRSLKALYELGVVEKQVSVVLKNATKNSKDLFRISQDCEKVEAFFRKDAKRKPAQAMALMRLQEAPKTYFSLQEVKALCGVTEQTVRALAQIGLLEPISPQSLAQSSPPKLSADQSKAVEAIIKPLSQMEHKTFLLFGVTGSGKTEVYLNAAQECLKQGRQVLYLVPEIALTAQVIGGLRGRFGKNVSVIHSHLSTQERLKTWIKIKRGETPIVLGARSALFSPLENLGLLILDEEHESSYKQDTEPRYQTKDVAEYLAKQSKAVLLLGSATPSIESYYRAEHQEIDLLVLPERVNSAVLPKIEIVDLKENYKESKLSIFSDPLKKKIEKTLKHQEQAILFLNRRAYAPFLMCRECGETFSCEHCAVTLSYHRKENSLKCHHCDYRRFPPDRCPKCSGLKVAPFGVGVEKVEEEVKALFPGARVARIDRDIAQKRGAVESLFTRFRSGEIDILCGTQMIAKGLDFPNVTLVGVISADLTLALPDFRSSERAYQLLSQVAGRAGRGIKPGEVIIQSFNPAHPALIFSKEHDYLSFYNSILEERKITNYPPFKRLVNILFQGENREEVSLLATRYAVRLSEELQDAQIFGPCDCPLERLQSKWRRHLLLKMPPHESLPDLKAIGEELRLGNVSIVVDVDPNFLM